MSENNNSREPNRLNRFLQKLTRKERSTNVEMLEAEARTKALEAVHLFVNAEKQQPSVIYHANGNTTFDFDKQKHQPATIIRDFSTWKWTMADGEEQQENRYHYWVVSADSLDKNYVWALNDNPLNANWENKTSGEFRSKGFHLILMDPEKREFEIEDTMRNFGFFEEYDDVVTINLAVMFGGMTETQKDPTKVKSKNLQLSPGVAPQPARP